VRQELTLAPDGQRVANVMMLRKLGLTVAALSEEIRNTP